METANKHAKKFISVNSLPYTLITVLAAMTLYPFYIVLLMAFKSDKETFLSFYAMPRQLYLDNIITAFKVSHYSQAFLNSFVITLGSTLCIILVTGMAGYAIARNNSFPYRFLYILFISGLMVPFQVIMVPLYKLGKTIGLISTYHGITVVYAALAVQSCVFLYTGFVKTIPREIEEAAIIDGCSVPGIYFRMVFPLLKPVTSTVIIINVIYIWNDFLLPLLFLQDPDMRTIPLQQYYFYGQYNNKLNLAYASFLLALVPILIFYFLMQKQIVKGIAAGAVKG